MQTRLQILTNVSLKPYNTLGIGGIAAELLVARTEAELVEGARRPHILIGRGSNVLFSDMGWPGLVLVAANDSFVKKDDILEAGAGLSLPKLSGYCLDAGITGFEWACGIPASVGGAVRMNAGAFGGCIADVLIGASVLRAGKIVYLDAKQCALSYRKSGFLADDVIVKAHFRIKRDEKADIYDRMGQYHAARKAKQPAGASCGSVFKNAEKPAGYYIERAGLKGVGVGDLHISGKHANFIINGGKGRAADFIALVNIIKAEVYNKFRVLLQEEFVRIGEH